jgi:hypothetical protein
MRENLKSLIIYKPIINFNMMKKLLFTTVMLIAFVLIGYAQVASDGDYRSFATGNWNDVTKWQVRTSGTWVAATVAPVATNNIYIQNGHFISVDIANASCKDLHINTGGGVSIGINVLNINGKIRAFSGSAVVSAADENYTGTSVGTALVSSMVTTTNTGSVKGLLKFVGNTRNITETGEWHASGTTPRLAFALNSGETGTLAMGIKSLELEFQSGNIIATSAAILAVGSNATNGNAIIRSGAKFTSARAAQVLTYNSSTAFPVFEIEAGAILELTNSNPEINCNTFINNGTVIYSGGIQNFAKTAFATADQLNSYHNLIVSPATSLTIPASKNIIVSGALTLTSGDLQIPSSSILELSGGNISIMGGSESSYIQTLQDGAVSGTLKVTGLSTAQTFPVGSANNYLPVTLGPTSSSDFTINVFEGATADATPNGAPLSADQKKRIVNAVWNINRTSGTGNCEVTLGWTNTLEGSDFASFTNSQIGIASYTNGAYSTFTGSGDNTANSASITVSAFSPMMVGELNATLPVKLISFTAKENLNSVNVRWKTTSEKNLARYMVQHANGSAAVFKTIYTVAAHNLEGTFDYSYNDVNPIAGANYYRLVSEDIDGTQYLSEIKSVSIKGDNLVSVYPNPISDDTFSVSGLLAGDTIRIIDLQGQVLLVQKNTNGSAVNKVDVKNIKSGIYMLSVENSGKTSTTKRLIKL